MILRSTISLLLFCSSLFVFGQKAGETKTYPIVVKFTSIGTGVPDKKPITEFIKAFQKKNKTKNIKADTIGPMGKEGEYYLGLLLTELNKKQKAAFIRQIKKVTKKTDDRGEIQYEENMSVNIPKPRNRAELQTIKIE